MKPKKVAVLLICLNEPYWEYIGTMMESAAKHFLSGHELKYFIWTDLPHKDDDGAFDRMNQNILNARISLYQTPFTREQYFALTAEVDEIVGRARKSAELSEGHTIIPTDPIPWPYPTLMRYHLFLQKEEELQDYDYIFYIDADMLFVDTVGDEILGDGLTAARHPMYALSHNLIPPYEPNPDSTAFIPMCGTYEDKRFVPLYAAGGFQGGTSDSFLQAMRIMKKNIDQDSFSQNYIARWNDESHWNRYLYENPPSIVLSPSYVYPDSLIHEYYVPKVWGRNYTPRLITITKKHSLSKEGGEAIREIIAT